MPTVNFYQVSTTTPAGVDAVLPDLLEKALAQNLRVVVRCPSLDRRDRLNNTLWSVNKTSFLPHASAEDGYSAHQPIFLTVEDTVPNNAHVCIILGGALGNQPQAVDLEKYQKVLDVFDSGEDQVKAARQRWKHLKDQEISRTYFAQTKNGWQKRA